MIPKISSLFKTVKDKNGTGRMVAFMSFSSLLANVLTIVSGLLIARWLLPEELGLFTSFNVLTSYIILVQLGVPSGLSRQLPFYMGSKEEEKARQTAAVANHWGLITGLACFGLSLAVAFYFLAVKNYFFAAGTFVIGISAFQGLYVTKYLKILYRSNNDFNKLSLIDIISALVSFAGIFLVWKYKFYGLCMRAAISVAVDLILAYQWRPIKVKYKWDKNYYKELMKIGFPIYWVANIYSLWPMVQRTVVVSLGGTKALGLFSLAVIVETGMKTLTNAISNISFPKMAFAWGQGASFINLLKVPLKPMIVSVIVNTVMAVAGWFLLPFFVQKLLPNYIEGTRAAQWMLWVGWLGSFSVFSNVYMVIQKNMDRLWSYIAGIAAWLLVCFVMYRIIGFNMVIFPIATLIGYLFIYLVDAVNFRRYYLFFVNRHSQNIAAK